MSSLMKKQTGSVLIISLLLLIVTTLLGLSSMNNTIMEEKMAGNLRQQNLALQASESALREAEARLGLLDKNTRPDASNNPASDDGTGTPAIWIKDAPEGKGSGVPTGVSGLWWADDSLWTSYGVPYTEDDLGYPTGNDVAFYIIEELEPVADTMNVGQQQDTQSVQDYFQITAYGVGIDGRAKAYLRSTFSRRF